MTDKITFIVEEVFQSELETGGSFKIMGYECVSLLEDPKPLIDITVDVFCSETFFNHEILSKRDTKVGDSLTL